MRCIVEERENFGTQSVDHMKRKEMRELQRKGFLCKTYERNLEMPLPKFEGIMGRLPHTVIANGYRVNFSKELWGGFAVDIVDMDGREVASGVKLRRWSKTDVQDLENKNRLELNLSFLSPHSLRLRVFEPPTVKS
jgi:hypothetical protein